MFQDAAVRGTLPETRMGWDEPMHVAENEQRDGDDDDDHLGTSKRIQRLPSHLRFFVVVFFGACSTQKSPDPYWSRRPCPLLVSAS